jgi:RNA polymerase sigma factor (sigma-70 family)
MKRSATGPTRLKGKRYMMAVVLGTALSALGSARAEAPDATLQAVTAIHRYCTACWRNAHLPPDTWTDCTQEVFCRLLERLAPDAWNQVLAIEGEERREFIRAIDTVKKRTQRSRKWSSGPVDAAADRQERYERRLADDRDAVRHAATALLSARQQRILQLSFEGWSVHDIAAEMKVPAERVSDEKYKAVHKLRNHFAPSEDL